MNNRFDNLEAAEARARELEAETGEKYVAFETDYACDPYAAERLPHVGDEVSKAFNGDYYPCGKIAKISKTYYRITTEDGNTFTRVGPNSWKEGGKKGAFSLIEGVVDRRNPHI